MIAGHWERNTWAVQSGACVGAGKVGLAEVCSWVLACCARLQKANFARKKSRPRESLLRHKGLEKKKQCPVGWRPIQPGSSLRLGRAAASGEEKPLSGEAKRARQRQAMVKGLSNSMHMGQWGLMTQAAQGWEGLGQ